jgi:hypothetical protein
LAGHEEVKDLEADHSEDHREEAEDHQEVEDRHQNPHANATGASTRRISRRQTSGKSTHYLYRRSL